MNGYLLVDKPADWTSFDVVNKLRRVSGVKKVGHAGTLDPFATGLLIILFGGYTKKQADFMKMDKTYEVTATLGKTSTTGDPEGEITDVSARRPSLEEVEAALCSFEGQIEQIPPQFSAIKVNGQRAYDLARKGKTVELQPRQVTIHGISDIIYEYPRLSFTASVSSGTYIRTLVEDVGNKLGAGAYTNQLRRTLIGEYSLDGALTLDEVTDQEIAKNLKS